MIDPKTYQIFKSGSRTYFYSSLFFPPEIKEDVFKLYRFVRVADDYVDASPQLKKEFIQFKNSTYDALNNLNVTNETITQFIEVFHKYNFDPSWVKSFVASMESDLDNQICNTIQDTEKYMYGSAEVIGLFMSKILKLPEAAYPYARLLGKSMQYANFIRDIAEDLSLDRQYLPVTELQQFNLNSLDFDQVKNNSDQFVAFINQQIAHYDIWQTQAEQGFKFIPLRYRIPIQTASDMYRWTINKISKDPMIVYKRKVKPQKRQILLSIFSNSIKGYLNVK